MKLFWSALSGVIFFSQLALSANMHEVLDSSGTNYESIVIEDNDTLFQCVTKIALKIRQSRIQFDFVNQGIKFYLRDFNKEQVCGNRIKGRIFIVQNGGVGSYANHQDFAMNDKLWAYFDEGLINLDDIDRIYDKVVGIKCYHHATNNDKYDL